VAFLLVGELVKAYLPFTSYQFKNGNWPIQRF